MPIPPAVSPPWPPNPIVASQPPHRPPRQAPAPPARPRTRNVPANAAGGGSSALGTPNSMTPPALGPAAAPRRPKPVKANAMFGRPHASRRRLPRPHPPQSRAAPGNANFSMSIRPCRWKDILSAGIALTPTRCTAPELRIAGALPRRNRANPAKSDSSIASRRRIFRCPRRLQHPIAGPTAYGNMIATPNRGP